MTRPMNLVKVGRWYVNLEYLILAEEWDAPGPPPAVGPGCLRVTVETGRVLDLTPPEADLFRRRLDELTEDPSARQPAPVAAVHVAGAGVPPADHGAPKRGKKRG